MVPKFLGHPVVSQYTVRLMTVCVSRILCLHNSSSVTYFRQPPKLPTAARRNRKWTECVTTAFGRNRMYAESAHSSTFGAETETEAEIRSTSNVTQIYCEINPTRQITHKAQPPPRCRVELKSKRTHCDVVT